LDNQKSTQTLFRVFQIAFVILGFYLALSLFEAWVYFPFWIKNITLIVSLGAVYFFIRKTLKGKNPGAAKGAWWASTLGVLGLLVAGVYVSGNAFPGRLVQAFTFSFEQPPSEVLLAIEITPPEHTGFEKTTLISNEAGPLSRKTLESAGPFPEGSLVSVRVSMDENFTPFISLGKDLRKAEQNANGDFETTLVLQQDAGLNIQAGPYVSISQPLTVSPDNDPAIEFSSIARITPRDSVELEATFSDDYGVQQVFLEVSGGGAEPAMYNLPFKGRQAGENQETFYINLLSDPRAGQNVTAKLVAIDGLGQRAETRGLALTLPKKDFKNTLAINLVDIRRLLLENPDQFNTQVQRLQRYSEDPDGFGASKSVYLALRSAYWRLRSAETRQDLDEVSRFLWQTALTVEDDGSFEEQVLRTLLEEMTQIAFEGGNVRDFEQSSVLLGAKARTLFTKEFGQTRRRFSFNAGVDSFELPQVKTFRELVSKLQFQAAENNRDGVLETLLESRALFENMSTPRNGVN